MHEHLNVEMCCLPEIVLCFGGWAGLAALPSVWVPGRCADHVTGVVISMAVGVEPHDHDLE